jgi:hypothetical protein
MVNGSATLCALVSRNWNGRETGTERRLELERDWNGKETGTEERLKRKGAGTEKRLERKRD